nr:hypothetical protein [Burkholderia ambifaria]
MNQKFSLHAPAGREVTRRDPDGPDWCTVVERLLGLSLPKPTANGSALMHWRCWQPP